MLSEAKNLNFQNKSHLKVINDDFNPSLPKFKEEEKSEDSKLIKPIPINPKLLTSRNNSIPNIVNTSVKINNFNQDAAMPIIYSKFPLQHQPESNNSLEEKNKYNFYHPKKSESLESNTITLNNSFIQKDKLCCSCTKTKCIKKYCECYANKKYCKECNCQDCMNKIEHLNNNTNQFINENEFIICTCSKSNCNKKYCECYKSGVKCNNKCRCVNCMNALEKVIFPIKEEFDNNNEINYKIKKNLDNNIVNKNNSEEKNSLRKNFKSNENLNDNYKIQRISVFINKNQTMINVEKFSKEEMNLLCKKRKND